jgi:hypothetical protein
MSTKFDTREAKSTAKYDHHDLEGVDIADIDQSTIRTVNMPNGNKLLIGKNTKTGTLDGLRLLVAKDES